MKNFTFTLLFLSALFLSANLFAQCPTGDVTLSTQAEIDQFVVDYPNCEVIEGNLKIDGATINDLSGLSKITKLETGGLTVKNTSAKNINFENLIFIGGDLRFDNNAVLEQVNIDNLVAIDFGDVRFYQNPKLTTITLNKLSSSIIALNITENASLTTLSLCVLPSTNQGELNIAKNASLTTLCFDNLTEVEAIFKIKENNQLRTVNTFQNLKSVGFDMEVSNNANLSSIDFSSLNKVDGDLYINRNPKLNSILFDKLSSTGFSINFSANTSLLNLDLSNLKSPSVGGMVDVSNNPVLTSLKLCSYSSANYIHLNQNISLTELCFDNLTTIDTELEINESGIKDLNAFKILASVGDIRINNNVKLQNINFDNLTTIENDIFISANSSLKSLNFCKVTNIGMLFQIYTNPLLESICFDELQHVSNMFTLSGTKIKNLNTFQNLKFIGADFEITNNPNLTDCSGLCNILNNNGVTGTITIANNPSECSSQSEVVSL